MLKLQQEFARPIKVQSVTEQVTLELRRGILSGDLAPGESLSLRKVAEKLEVSFIPVRDALSVLEGEGLVINPRGKGATVAPLNMEEFHAIYRVSRMLEPELARRSCQLMSNQKLDELFIKAADLGASNLNVDAIWHDHRVFHMELLSPAASPWDVRILTMNWRATERYLRIAFGKLDPDPQEHLRRKKAHQLLIEAFKTRDPSLAAQALEAHLVESESLATNALSAAFRD